LIDNKQVRSIKKREETHALKKKIRERSAPRNDPISIEEGREKREQTAKHRN